MWGDALLFAATAGTCLYLRRLQQERDHNDDDAAAYSSSSSSYTSLLQRLKDGTSLDANERICTVTPDNQPTPHGNLRSEMRLNNLWHRATYIVVLHEGESLQQQQQQQQQRSQREQSRSPMMVLVQRRSTQKDYCPGKLDPTPGGVVGFGESYQQNAVREIHEEMGIDVTDGNPLGNRLDRLFTFDYQDERVKVWGDFYELRYYGTVENLAIQREEVAEVIPMTLVDLERMIEDHPDEFMPDSCYAMRLYFQRKLDMQVNRRLLKGYSSGDLDKYKLRPKPEVIFFDCDDTLYFDNWQTANRLTAKIEEWCVKKVGLPPGRAYELYKQYGTALRGLLAEGYIENNTAAIDAFLEEVHDIPIHELIKPDKKLREMLLKIDPSIPKYIFTASVSHHALRCLKALEIEDIFENVVIDVKRCDLETKHSRHSFNAAMRIAQVNDPEACVFLDDSVTNIKAAREIGWRSVLVGKVGRDSGSPIFSDHAELEVDRIHDIAEVLPEIFVDCTLLTASTAI